MASGLTIIFLFFFSIQAESATLVNSSAAESADKLCCANQKD
jgi:hypothetical protein